MPPCELCNDLIKKNKNNRRLAFDFTPADLVHSACTRGCLSCNVILEGLRKSETQECKFERDVRRVYAYCLETRNDKLDSLLLKVYFADERPKLELEFFSTGKEGTLSDVRTSNHMLVEIC